MRLTLRLLCACALLLPLTACGSSTPTGVAGPPGGPPGMPPGMPGGMRGGPDGGPGGPDGGRGRPGGNPEAIGAALRKMEPKEIKDESNTIAGYAFSGDQVTNENLHDAMPAILTMKHVSFSNAPMGSAAFKELGKAFALHELEFSSVKMSAADLVDLSALPGLEKLELKDTGLTDAGLHELAAFKHLKELKIEKADVSDAAVTELKKELPDCKITVVK